MDTENKKTEDIGIEEFVDMYGDEDKKEPGFLDDLTPEFNVDDVDKINREKEEKEKGGEPPAVEDIIPPVEEQKEPEKKTDDALSLAVKSLVDDGYILPFEGDKKIEEYTQDEWVDLIKSNVEEMVKQSSQDELETMSPETRALLQYERDGGKDIKGMMAAIASAKETYDYDISTPQGQKEVVRAYFKSKNVYKNAESLEKELNRIEDAGELQEKAEEFKPMLEEMQVNEVNRQLRIQAEQKQKINEQLKLYNESIKNTLMSKDINGIEMSGKVKNMIFNGLTANNYQTVNGRKTNLLYHLLERKQYLQPDHSLIAEVTWLLADPEGYRNAVRKSVKKEVTEQTASKIKNEQQGAGNQQQQNERKVIKRPMRNFFS